jgi:phosphatidate cytidylyltransferase
LKKRIVTGVIGGALFLSLVIQGGIGYMLLLFFVAAFGFYEWARMNGIQIWQLHGMIGLLFTLYYFLPDAWVVLKVSDAVLLEVMLLLIVSVITKNKVTIQQTAYLFLGSVYIGMALHYMAATRLLSDGLTLTLAILFATWATDTAAYFTGRAIGKHKLWAAISPNKTIEGAIGGIIAAVIVLVGFSFFSESLSLGFAIVLAGVVSVSGQLGDLLESAVKRVLGVKDSGQLLPGHGGVLDRFDSLLFVFPTLHLLSLL